MRNTPESKASRPEASWLQPAVWLLYPAIGLEILFMITPAGLYFYSLYGPVLNILDYWTATAWLTQFFLPHISTTRSLVLNALPRIGGVLALVGTAWFLIAAIQLYSSKFHRRGMVTTGLYGLSRHPQYTGLAALGLGALLLWPRFLVLIAYLGMLFLYRHLAAMEERRCEAAFGASYRDYRAGTPSILPFFPAATGVGTSPRHGAADSPTGDAHIAGPLALSAVCAVLIAFGLREYSLASIASVYEDHAAVLSPAPLDTHELLAAYHTALRNADVRRAVTSAGESPLLIHVVPTNWHLADLPMEAEPGRSGHDGPEIFDRGRYKLLLSRTSMHRSHAVGKDILRFSYGLKPFLLAQVDIRAGRVTSVETPPAHVRWGDIPAPLY